MAAFLSFAPVGVFIRVPAAQARASLRFVWTRPMPAAARPVAHWQRAADGRLVCRWQPADPIPLH
jgi:hypothetical protein